MKKDLKVGIIMGSDSDLEVMSEAAKVLEEFGVSYEMTVSSAHRAPNLTHEYATSAKDKGMKVLIASIIQSSPRWKPMRHTPTITASWM